MDIRETLLRHRKDTRWIVGALLGLLAVLSLIYYFLQRGSDLPSDLATDRVLLFVLWYINVVLILAILFTLLRNLYKLAIERRHRILGSKFRTKLVATHIGLALIPGLLLFAYGSQMLQGWIDQWFNEPAIRQVLEQGHGVAQELNRQIEQTLRRDTGRVLDGIAGIDPADPRRRPRLARRLQDLLNELEVDYLALYAGTDFIHAVLNSQSGMRDLPEPEPSYLQDALRQGDAIRVQTPAGGQGRLILAAVSAEGEDEARPVAVAGILLDPVLAGQSENLIQAYQGYRQLEVRKRDIEATYLLTFLMVTLVILLAASWTGFYLARGVTVPIQALAEGTRRITSGDLDTRVDVAAGDEVGVLVDSFNRMASELQRNKELLEESNLELVATNQRLAEERAVISAVLQNVAAGVISVNEEGRILTCNGAALNMLEQRGEDIIGKSPREAWPDGERGKLAALFEQPPDASGRLNTELRMVLGSEWKTFEAKLTTMRDQGGQITGRVMVLEDLTRLIEAQQTAAWNEAARRIAHEIKNPLTPIKLSAERLLRRFRQGSGTGFEKTLEEGVEIIVREVQGMQSMVDEFSRFARMPRPHPAQVDLKRLVEETLHLYEGLKPGVEVDGKVEPSASTAWVDAEQFKRVLINLLDNALEATDPPGKVRVTVGKGNGTLAMSVSDTGPGIPFAARSKVFLPHFSTKGRGTGLGLSIVHRIVADHHGTIRVEDNRPRGTVFTVEIPQQ